MGEVYPEAQREVAAELAPGARSHRLRPQHPRTPRSPVRRAARGWPISVLTSDGEFHSARRQLARWEEAGAANVDRVSTEPFDTFPERFLAAARAGGHHFIFVSQVMFGSGRIFDPSASWLLWRGPTDHGSSSTAIMPSWPSTAVRRARCAIGLLPGRRIQICDDWRRLRLHARAARIGPRPRITGWFAEFEDLSLPPGQVGYAKDAGRFLGATFDPSALYRFTAIRRMLAENDLTTAQHLRPRRALQQHLLGRFAATPLAKAELLNPLDGGPHARFLAFRSRNAQRWYAGAQGAQLNHRRPRRRVADRLRHLSGRGGRRPARRASGGTGMSVTVDQLRSARRSSSRCCSSPISSIISTGRSSAFWPGRSSPTCISPTPSSGCSAGRHSRLLYSILGVPFACLPTRPAEAG